MAQFWSNGNPILAGKIQATAELPACLGGSPLVRLLHTTWEGVIPAGFIALPGTDIADGSIIVRFRATASTGSGGSVRLAWFPNTADAISNSGATALGSPKPIDSTGLKEYDISGITITGTRVYTLQTMVADGQWITIHDAWMLPSRT